MGVCWYCHWGWAKRVAEIYREAVNMAEDAYWALHFGPTHIIWEDENFDDHSIEFCTGEMSGPDNSRFSEMQLEAVRWSLEELAKIPEHERCIEPDGYDGEHPERYPPKCEVMQP